MWFVLIGLYLGQCDVFYCMYICVVAYAGQWHLYWFTKMACLATDNLSIKTRVPYKKNKNWCHGLLCRDGDNFITITMQ